MDLQITNHARTRLRQRGIDALVLNYLIQYGDAENTLDGAYRISITKRNANKIIMALKEKIHKIEKARGIIIVQKDGAILTGYHRS